MNTTRTIEGKWWIYGELSACSLWRSDFHSRKNGLELEHKNTPKTVRANKPMYYYWSNWWPESIGKLPRLIHGADQHNNDVTLFGCSIAGWDVNAGLDGVE